MAEHHASRTAPFYEIPSRRLVCIEHPAIIKNVDKAIDTLQGSRGIIRTLNPPKADTPANIVLRPEDAMARPLQSISLPSSNILLQVTVPKRTGRRRKRGSDEPFTEDPEFSGATDGPPRPTAHELLRTLRDNVGKYQVKPVGLVERTHVFRGMPDFVFSTTQSSFVNRFRENILPFDFRKMKQFDLDMSKGITSNVDIIPPPSFSLGDIPFNYFYRQNAAVRQTRDKSGNITTVNTQQAAKILTHLVPYDIPTVPSRPRPECPPIETLEQPLRQTINIIGDLFKKRKAYSRRALRNALETIEQRYALRYAVPYVGYIFRSGPWRDAIVVFGHDPRTDPNSCIYQTVMFRILPREAETARDRDPGGGRRHNLPRPNEITSEAPTTTTSHLFTGQPPLPLDGRMWMFCDITDPLLASILSPSQDPDHPEKTSKQLIRSTCDILADGWYHNGTLAKLKAIMRHKIHTLFEGRTPNDEDFIHILTFPDHVTSDAGLAAFWLDPGTATGKEMAMATEIRGTIRGATSWKEREKASKKRERELQGGEGNGDGEEGDGNEDGDGEVENEEVSEGEEEAIEQAEIMEAASEAVDAAARRGQEDGDNYEMEDDEIE
ncbi:RNA polymerase III transcription factor IIIC subunit-domain-containing protein [Aspergillus californicus]